MAILKILKDSDARLRIVAAPITTFDDSVQKQANDMIQTMKACNNAVGLAGPQVDYPHEMIVVCLPKDVPIAMCNPRLLRAYGRVEVKDEGCLSVSRTLGPHRKEIPVARYTRLKISYQTTGGEHRIITCKQLMARAIQHEMDHLRGVIIGDATKIDPWWKMNEREGEREGEAGGENDD